MCLQQPVVEINAVGCVYSRASFFYAFKEVKLSLCLTKHHAMKTYGQWIDVFSTPRDESEVSGQRHAPAAPHTKKGSPEPIG
jgi:hypothetical protein